MLDDSDSTVVSGSAATLDELESRIREFSPDLVVADLPEGADEVTGSMIELVPAVLILTEADRNGWLPNAPTLGGRAVLDPDASADEILGAIEAIASGLVVLSPRRAQGLVPMLPRTNLLSMLKIETVTGRELEVLGMLAEGLGNKTIAYRLGISEHTVKFHVSSIMRKLEAGSRTEAVTIGVRHGLITV